MNPPIQKVFAGFDAQLNNGSESVEGGVIFTPNNNDELLEEDGFVFSIRHPLTVVTGEISCEMTLEDDVVRLSDCYILGAPYDWEAKAENEDHACFHNVSLTASDLLDVRDDDEMFWNVWAGDRFSVDVKLVYATKDEYTELEADGINVVLQVSLARVNWFTDYGILGPNI